MTTNKDITSIITNNHFLCYIVGNTNSGKSNLAKYIIASMFSQKKFNMLYVFSPTAKISDDGAYSMIDQRLIFKIPTEQKIKQIMNVQKKNPKLKTLIIMDDCLGVLNKESKIYNNLVISHRHYRISIIFISQYLKAINPVWRSNFHYLFSSKVSNYENLKKYKEIWFNDVQDIQEHFNKYTKGKYRFIFVDLFKPPEEKYKSIKVPKQEDFKLSIKI